METHENEFEEIFSKSNLKNVSFCFYCPNVPDSDKNEIIQNITKNKGVRNLFLIYLYSIELFRLFFSKIDYYYRKYIFMEKNFRV